MTNTTHAFDATAVLQTSGAVAAPAAGTNIEDLGPGIGHRVGKVVVDVTALKISANDEIYTIFVQGSPDSDFGTAGNIVDLASLTLCAKEVKLSDSDRDDATGRRSIFFENLDETGTPLRYLRLYIYTTGTSESITFSARLVSLDNAISG